MTDNEKYDVTSATVGGFILGLVFGLMLTTWVTYAVVSYDWRVDTVQRGLAMYCPLDGRWAWRGECDPVPAPNPAFHKHGAVE